MVPGGVWRGLEPRLSPGKMAEGLNTPHPAPCPGKAEETAAVQAPVTSLVWKLRNAGTAGLYLHRAAASRAFSLTGSHG